MSLQEIFYKVQGWPAELWTTPWGTLFFWTALIISAISAIITLAVSTSASGNWKDDSDVCVPKT